MYAEGKANATEAHIYTLKVRLGPEDTKEILIIRDNGTGISSTFFEEEASSLGHTRGYTAKYLVEKKGLGRHGGNRCTRRVVSDLFQLLLFFAYLFFTFTAGGRPATRQSELASMCSTFSVSRVMSVICIHRWHEEQLAPLG